MIGEIQRLVNNHGEVHAILAEHDDELELRQGQTTFHENFIRVQEHSTVHIVNPDEIVRVYTPTDALH